MSLGILVWGKVYGSALQQSRSNDKPVGTCVSRAQIQRNALENTDTKVSLLQPEPSAPYSSLNHFCTLIHCAW